ncbi:DMT family transporter [Haloferula sp. A504]|uniref:DMT family transporter n=1 Tax=Haloferula sp. A504 TaxID=3373601 RepID=UPI0031C175E6|nr:DMT family transporter [Verrucomicrobiaceae bacterium E54]
MPATLQIHLLVFLVAFTAVFGKLYSGSAVSLVTWRVALAAVTAFLWVRFFRRHPISTDRWPAMIGVGVVIGLHWLCFFGAIQLANISICLTGMATISLFTAFTEPLFERRRVRPFEVFLGLIVAGGIALVANVEREHLAGLGVALLGALLAAIFPVLNRRLVHTGGDPLGMVGWEMIGASLICLIALPFLDPGGYPALLEPRGLDWLWLFLISMGCTVFGFAWHIHLLRKITAYAGNLAMNCEPIYGIAMAILFFREDRELHPLTFIAVLAIVGTNLAHPWLERRTRSGSFQEP